MRNRTLYVGVVHHAYGVNLYAGTLSQVEAQIDEYVKSWWVEELPDEPMPDTADERVDTYFELVECEWYEIDDVTVDLDALEGENAAAVSEDTKRN